jgi:hypothetical protein
MQSDGECRDLTRQIVGAIESAGLAGFDYRPGDLGDQIGLPVGC